MRNTFAVQPDGTAVARNTYATGIAPGPVAMPVADLITALTAAATPSP